MNVLSVTSEFAPLVKTGGLADVAGALPAAMAGQGVHMRTLLPGYPAVMAALKGGREVMADWDLFGAAARVVAGKAEGQDLLVLDAPHLFERDGSPYLDASGHDWPDNPTRFAALGWMAARVAMEGVDGWLPNVVHCHDWQAGLAPVYLAERMETGRPGILLTIHNIAFQGLAPATQIGPLRLPPYRFNPEGFEYYGQVSALKAGLVFADKINTVSPTYAREIMTADFGMGLEGVLRSRATDVSGILNGIDTKAWNPGTDPAIPSKFKSPKTKAKNKAALRDELGLPDADGPLAVVVSRLTRQKGLDVLLAALPDFLSGGGQLALLGSGEADLEVGYRDLAT
ncbi:MAG: glycogen/starch synthase, partial [Pseudomonadota bacterium]